jgi:hypothetical protein
VPSSRSIVARRALPLSAGASLLLLAGASACSRGDTQPLPRESRGDAVASSEPPAVRVLDSLGAPYTVREVRDGGSIRGTVRVEGAMPADTTIRTGRDERACGATLVDRTIERRGDALGGAIVWVAGLRSGKPLSAGRRFEVTLDDCQLTPRVQAVRVGGTLNVGSRDPIQTRFRFVRQPAGQPIAFVTTNDAGQVVPEERVLREAGQVDIRNDTHPWVRGYLFVFDQPYYAATPPAGTFTIDDVPAGSYRLSAWHERFGRVDTTVTVQAGQATEVTVRMR